jgi:hypothetical protein
MNIYVAVRDPAEGSVSQVIGSFSTEEKARAAAQDIEDADNGHQLDWRNTSAIANDGDTYDVILTELDEVP